MKITIENQITEPIVTFSLEDEGSFISLVADDGTLRKKILHFYPDGRVYRIGNAQIGEFKFDKEGKIIIN